MPTTHVYRKTFQSEAWIQLVKYIYYKEEWVEEEIVYYTTFISTLYQNTAKQKITADFSGIKNLLFYYFPRNFAVVHISDQTIHHLGLQIKNYSIRPKISVSTLY